MKIKTLEHWKGVLGILMAAGAPWGAWAASGAQLDTVALVGVIVPSALAALAAVSNWIDESISKAAARKAEKAAAPKE